MLITEVITKDKDGFRYKYPDRDCEKCEKYPCIENMSILKSNFAKFGCKNYQDVSTTEWKPKK